MLLNLPGHADNIRLTEHGTLFIPFALLRQSMTRQVELPKYGLLVEYDLNSRKPIRSWHDPSGQIIEAISHAELFNKKIYLGSIYIDYIGVVDY